MTMTTNDWNACPLVDGLPDWDLIGLRGRVYENADMGAGDRWVSGERDVETMDIYIELLG